MLSTKKVSFVSIITLLTSMGIIIGPSSASAAGFTSIRIGDVDGFGYGKAEGYSAANGGKANANGGSVLDMGDFLPDLNKNGILATGQGDDFDNRTGVEKNNQLLTGSGFRDKGSKGSMYTDISLSTSFLKSLPGIDSIANEKEKKISQREQLKAEKVGITDKIKDLKQQIQDTKVSKINTLEDERKSMQETVKDLQENIKDVRQGKDSDFDSLKADIADKEAQKRDAPPLQKPDIQAEIDNLESELKKAKNSKITSLNTQIDEQKGKIDGVNTQIQNVREEKDRDIEGLVTQKTSLEVEQDNKQNEIEKLNQEIKEKQKQLGNSKIPQPEFTFDFSVKKKDIKAGSPLFFNLLFADYDVKDAKVGFTTANGGYFEKQLVRQNNKKGEDGLIQSAFVELGFSDIFTASQGGFDGFLTAKLIAPDEPYMAFDYAEISTKTIADSQSVPEPTAIFGLITFAAFAKSSMRKRKQEQC